MPAYWSTKLWSCGTTWTNSELCSVKLATAASSQQSPIQNHWLKKNGDEKIKITHRVLPAGCQIWNSPPQTALGLM